MGETTGKPAKKSKVKQAWEAKALVDELLEKFGSASLDELREELDKGAAAQPAAEEPIVADDAPHQFGTPIEEDPSGPDPLGWIDESVDYVGFVSKRSAFIMRPNKPNWNPPMEAMTLSSNDNFGPWAAMPFDITVAEQPGADIKSVQVYERQQRAIWRNWHHFILTREFAEEMYMDPRWPKPKAAVIAVENYRGWNEHSRRAMGRSTKLENVDVLREVMRLLLQRRMDLFLDANQCPVGTMNPAKPNPYNKSNRLGSFGIHAKHVDNVQTAERLAKVQGYTDYNKEQ